MAVLQRYMPCVGGCLLETCLILVLICLPCFWADGCLLGVFGPHFLVDVAVVAGFVGAFMYLLRVLFRWLDLL